MFTYQVSTGGVYEIEAVGAEGGDEHFTIHEDASGGAGADVSGQFTLTTGERRGRFRTIRVSASTPKLILSTGRDLSTPSSNASFERVAGNVRRRSSQIEHPGLPDEIMAERVMWLFVDEAEPRRLIDAARGDQYVVGP